MFHVGRAGVDEFAFDACGTHVFLEFDAEVRGVCWVLLVFSELGSVVVEEVHGGIVRGHECVGRIFGDEVLDGFPFGVEFLERFQAECVGSVAAVRGPLSHLVGVERGLRAVDCGEGETGGLAGDRVLGGGVGEVGMECEPEAGAGTCGTAACGDAGFVDVPFFGLAADELQCARGVMQRGFDGRDNFLGL